MPELPRDSGGALAGAGRDRMVSTRPDQVLKATVKRCAPRLTAWVQNRRAVTVQDGWESYARALKPDPDSHLGDEWNNPAEMGLDCASSDFVDVIDRQVIEPFLGTMDTALDIGAGGGRFTEVLLPKARHVIASEVAPSMLPHLRGRFHRDAHVEYLLLDGRGLRPLRDGSVDAVLSYGVFGHLQHWDIFNYLVEIERVLVPGGKALIHHANTFSTLGWQAFLADLPGQVGHHKYPGTLTVMTPDLFAEFSTRAGLDLVDCVTEVVKRDAISLLQKHA